jgi:hypothetical protein
MADLIGNDQGPLRDVTVAPELWPERENVDRTWWSARLAARTQEGLPAVKEDFKLGERAGLDAFALLIGENHLPSSQFAPGMRLAAQAARASKVKLLPDLWGSFATLDESGMRRYGQRVKDYMDAYPGAFLSKDGRPIISLGCPLGYGRAHDNYAEWSHVKPLFDAWGGPGKVYIVLNITWDRGDLTGGWADIVDSYSLWAAVYGWADRDPKGVERLASLATEDRKNVAWPVHSGYFGGRKGCESMAETLGVSTFCDMWRESISRGTAMTQVETWNDFSEDHAITETNYRGDSLIQLNRYFADWKHSGKPPAPSKEQVYLFHHRQLVDAKLTNSTIVAHNDKWHSTPSTDYLNVVTILKSKAKVALTDGGQSWTVEAPAGFHEWLVYVPSKRIGAGTLKEAWNLGAGISYPTANAERSVTVAETIPEGVPSVSVSRMGKTVATLHSRLPISSTGRWQDLATVGSELDF